ncbi:MAG: hypothetical protein ACLFTR_05780 [Candidatus Woesearchaeota archaeon]
MKNETVFARKRRGSEIKDRLKTIFLIVPSFMIGGFIILLGSVLAVLLFFPVWFLFFIVTLPFKRLREKTNSFFLGIVRLMKFGLEMDECEICNADGSSLCTEECYRFHEELRKEFARKEKRWNKSLWGWIEKNLAGGPEPMSAMRYYSTGRSLDGADMTYYC